MTYADNYNIRTTSVKFNDVGDALDGLITRNYAGLTTGTSTAYIATPSPAWDAYTTSGLVVIIPHVTNTGAATINISGLGARDLRIGNAAIATGVLQQNIPTIMAYTGTYFEVLLQNVSIPTGTIYTYAGASAPSGYLICDGTAVNTYTYRFLHAIISNSYGGSGTAYNPGVTDQPGAVTTFNLPDLRRRVPVGKGASDTLGADDGVATYSSRSANQSHSVPAHYHAMSGSGTTLAVDIAHTHSSSSVSGTVGGSDGTHTHGTSLIWQVDVNYASTVHAANAFPYFPRAETTTDPYSSTNGAVATTTTGSGHGHSHSLTAAGQTLSTTSKTPTGSIGNVSSGISGNSAMTSGAGQYLYINYIIKT